MYYAGNQLVIVVLCVAGQISYKVLVGDMKLDYRDAIKGFRG